MVFGWFKRRKRRKYVEEETPPDWAPHLNRQPFVAKLSDQDIQRLVGLARGFEEQVNFEGCEGMKVDEAVRRSISLQACRLILRLGLDAYRKVRTVLVYPGAFMAESDQGPLRAAGLAVPGGTVILAWDHVAHGARKANDGRNVVYHEFAHKLDMEDGVVDGMPPMACKVQRKNWKRVVFKGHRDLKRRARKGHFTVIDPYGATSEVEFFAEATEVFFEQPNVLKRKHRKLYRALSAFYRQNPAG